MIPLLATKIRNLKLDPSIVEQEREASDLESQFKINWVQGEGTRIRGHLHWIAEGDIP